MKTARKLITSGQYKTLTENLNAAIEHLGTMAEFLKEAHEDEINDGHAGDGPEGCTYCQAIIDADRIAREANGLEPRKNLLCNQCETERPIMEDGGEAFCLLCGSTDIGLASTLNAPSVGEEVEQLDPEDGREHETLSAAFEHGHWWLMCGACGASWSVVDEEKGLGLERIDQGDDSCPTS